MQTNPFFFTSRRDFLKTTTVWVGGALAGQGLSARSAEAVAGVPGTRLARLATGANVCRWFRFPRAETPEHFGGYMDDAEAEAMAGLGLKHIRLCVAPKVVMETTTGAVRPDRFGFVEAAVRRFHKVGIAVIVNLHNEDRTAELDPGWQSAFVAFWGDLSKRLSGTDPDLTFLELMNEPVFDKREKEWDALALRLLESIRRGAPEHTLVTSGPNWGGIDGLQKVALLPDRNVVYSFHCYDPHLFTHQGATWSNEAVKPLRGVPYPSSPESVAPLLGTLDSHPESKGALEKYGREGWNREKLTARFRRGIDWGTQHGVPLYCGEFGVYPTYARQEDRAAWFRDFGQVLAEHRIGWAVWGWDEGFGLNRRKAGSRLEVDTVVAEALGLRRIRS